MKYDLNDITSELMFDGLFSEYLPDNFNLLDEHINIFKDIEICRKNDFVEPYKFTMSRFAEKEKRRTICLPELSPFINVIKYMRDENREHVRILDNLLR